MIRGSVLRRSLAYRSLHSSCVSNAASFFNMPAMSPTMAEGGIVEWKFKDGESFKSGDVLLEIETDKSNIDVEAVDDGILVKLLEQNGAKGVPVNKPIAIIAEPEDDITTLELPTVEKTAPAPAPQKAEAESKPAPTPAAAAAAAPAPTPSPKSTESTTTPKPSSTTTTTKANPSQKLFPSVEILLHLNHISTAEAFEKIPATGPKGRLLKGDVLAYLGKISKESTVSIASFIKSKEHLDLSNIVVKAPEPNPETPKSETPKVKETKKAREPVVIKRSFDLGSISEQIKAGGSQKDIVSVVKLLSKKAETYAYSKASIKKSGLYDEIFEDLLVPRGNVSRFKVSLDFNQPKYETKSVKKDIFDVLSNFKQVGSTEIDATKLEVSIEVNEKIIDSKQKVDAYLKKFEEYLR